ncbi:unnamed protein product [Calicophoron daubneyi]|uniref:Uncharacterized protein n=1 Tax=Calicophoron daubneyi TaxID=300641 RepID=A0AAV2TEY3_CALDB
MPGKEQEKPNISKNAALDITVLLLNDKTEEFKLNTYHLGQELYDLVLKKFGRLEYQYFDLEFIDIEGNQCWLDHNKPLMKVVRAVGTVSLNFFFAVKYYVPYPNLLEDASTRYLFALQIKRDFFRGLLHSNRNTSLLLAAFIVQSELGDYKETECKSYAYLKKHHLLRSAPDSYLMRLMELHQTLVGLTKADADYRLLDVARKVELYGIWLHPVRDATDQQFNLGVSYSGIAIFQNFSRINTFSWSKIRKLSFKRRRFVIKLHTDDQEHFADTAEFNFLTKNGCKMFWKKCIEQHAFFRSLSTFYPSTGPSRSSGGLLGFSRASSFPSLKRLRRSASVGASGGPESFASSTGPSVHGPVSDTVTSTNHPSLLSTPIRKLARFRSHGSNHRLNGHSQPRPTSSSDDTHSFISASMKTPGLLSDLPYSAAEVSAPTRPAGVTKLLSTYPNPTAEHFQLLRLSFTSLIPESNADTGQNTPLFSHRRIMEPMRHRAVSTPSISRTEHPRRRVGSHAFVPRQYAPSFPSTLRRSQPQSCSSGFDLSQGSSFPERPHFDREALATHTVLSACNLLQTTNTDYGFEDTDKNNLVRRESSSSSCSLSSNESPTPVSWNSAVNGSLVLPSPRADLNIRNSTSDEHQDTSSWLISTKNENHPVPFSIKAPTNISSPQLNMPPVSMESSSRKRRITSDFGLVADANSRSFLFHGRTSKIPLNRAESMETPTKSVASVILDSDNEQADIKTNKGNLLSSAHRPQTPRANHSSDHRFSWTSDTNLQSGEESPDICFPRTSIFPRKGISESVLASSEFQPPESGAKEIDSAHTDDFCHPSVCTKSETKERRSEGQLTSHTAAKSKSTQDELEDSRRSDRECFSDNGFLMNTSDGTSSLNSRDEPMPESLGDAMSLGAISMRTSLSCYDLSDGDGAVASNLEQELMGDRLNKSSENLRQLEQSPSSSSSGQNLLYQLTPSPKLSKKRKPRRHFKRAKSESAVAKRIPSESSDEYPLASRRRPLRRLKRRHKTDKQTSDASNKLLPNAAPRPPVKTVSPGERNNVQIMKRALQTEWMFSRELAFLSTYPLEVAESLNCQSLVQWLTDRLLPLLEPLINRHASFLNVLENRVAEWERSLLPSSPSCDQLASTRIRQNSPLRQHPLDKTDSLAALSDERLAETKVLDSASSSASREYVSPPRTTYSSSVSQPNILARFSPGGDESNRPSNRSFYPGAVFKEYLDMLQLYSNWVSESPSLITGLWSLAQWETSDPRSNQLAPLKSRVINTRRRQMSTDASFASNSSSLQRNNQQSEYAVVRNVWQLIESFSPCTLPFLTYLLRPGRHMRQYCVLIGSLFANYPPDHPDVPVCKGVFTKFVQSARLLYPVYRNAEHLCLLLECSRRVFPTNGFWYNPFPDISTNAQNEDNRVWKSGTIPTFQPSGLIGEAFGSEKTPTSPQGESRWTRVLSSTCLHRFGWLKKYSKRGFQPRMVFLFSDRVVYASRIRGLNGLYLKVHGIVSLRGAFVEKDKPLKDGDDALGPFANSALLYSIGLSQSELSELPEGVPCSSALFAIVVTSLDSDTAPSSIPSDKDLNDYNVVQDTTTESGRSRSKHRKSRRKLLFAAPNGVTRDIWVEDFTRILRSQLDSKSTPESNSVCPTSRNLSKLPRGIFRLRDPDVSDLVCSQVVQRHYGSRPGSSWSVNVHNTTTATESSTYDRDNILTICWRRHLSVSPSQLLNANDCEMNGFLLRKLKHGSAWQKLWVVLSDVCLFFFKAPNDAQPIARLTLLGYTVELVEPSTLEPKATCPEGAHSQSMDYLLALRHNSKHYYFRTEKSKMIMSWYHALSAVLACTKPSVGSCVHTQNAKVESDGVKCCFCESTKPISAPSSNHREERVSVNDTPEDSPVRGERS